ncbi:MAG: TraB/GumN family protein [Phyllobacterium sp.]
MNTFKNIIAADLANPLLRLVALANTLLFASFIFVLLAAGHARAEEAVCKRTDLVAGMARTDPAKLEAIRMEAAKTPNGQGLLWKIEKDGVKPSWLFGTMHLTDPRVVNLTEQAETARDRADIVAIEATEILDQKAMVRTMAERPDLMMFTDSTTLEKLLPADRLGMVKAALEERGIPLSSVQKMKPWMLLGMLALPSCELKRKKDGAPFLDLKLAEEAKAKGKTLEGLETIVEQLDAMASLPMQFHIDGLVETLALGQKMDDVIETMIVLYSKGEISMILPLMRAVSPENTAFGDGYATFEEAIVTARNRTMAERGSALVDKGNAFIAVGALHLPGENGLIELLRKRGYKVSRADR